jgi:hypothetical protein
VPVPDYAPDIESAAYVDLSGTSIPLGTMSEWVDSITLNGGAGPTTITVGKGQNLQEALMIAVPDLGIGADAADFQKGAVSGNGDLVFTADAEARTLFPKSADKLNVYLRVLNSPHESGHYPVTIDLKWVEAVVKPGENGIYRGSLSLPVQQMATVFDQYRLATMPMYLYVGGPFNEDNQAEAGLKAGEDWLIGTGEGKGIEIKNSLSFSEVYPYPFEGNCYDGDLVKGTASCNLAGILAKEHVSALPLEYWIQMNSWTVRAGEQNAKITADIVALLPVQFSLVEENVEKIDGKNYVSLLTMTDYGVKDLFGRDAVGVITENITSVRLYGKGFQNTVFSGPLFLRIADEKTSFDQLVKIAGGTDFTVDFAGAPYIPSPFHPAFTLYLEQQGNTFIRAAPVIPGTNDTFSLVLSAEISGEIDYEQEL